ncbi:MAG: hypothetical protein K6A65_00765 [Succinivibrionaceae bacterium]|nr:hypothetical protein [Succinivibrionaceae bacterium]
MAPDTEQTLILNLVMLIFTVPFHYLRYRIFSDSLRIGKGWLLLCYLLVLLGKTFFFNLELQDGAPPSWNERNRFYLLSMLAFNLLFFVAIRPFWHHVFVLGLFLGLSAPYILVPSYVCTSLLSGNYLLGNLMIGIMALLLMLASFRPLERWIKGCLATFDLDERPRFWRVFSILPFCFLAFEVCLVLGTTSDDSGHSLISALSSLAGALGLISAVEFLKGQMRVLRANRLLRDNLALADQIFHLRLRQFSEIRRQQRVTRKLRHDFKHFSMIVAHHLARLDWAALAEDCREYRAGIARQDGPPLDIEDQAIAHYHAAQAARRPGRRDGRA